MVEYYEKKTWLKVDEHHENKMNIAIEKAKEKVMSTYGGKRECRNWLEATPENSYGNEHYKVTVLVWSGSPPKGYVFADHNSGVVKAFGVRLKPLYTYHAYD